MSYTQVSTNDFKAGDEINLVKLDANIIFFLYQAWARPLQL